MLHVRAWAGRLMIAGAAAGAMTAGAPGRAVAACTASTPASQRLADNASDGQLGLAPEITFVDAMLGSACDLVVLTSLGDRSATVGLIPYETLATYIDTDGNPATGSPQWNGADKVVVVFGQRRAGQPAALGTWTGAAFSFAAGITLPVVGASGFAANLDQLGVSGPTTLGLRVASSWTGLRDTYDDLAPKRGGPSFAFPVTFTTDGAPPAPATPASRRRPRPDDLHGPEGATPAVTGGAQEACARRVSLASRERLEQPQAPARVAHPPGRRHVDHSAGFRRRGAFLTARHPATAAAQPP